MRLVTLNLRHGGVRHMPAVLDKLLGYKADLLVLTEFRNNPTGAALREALAGKGLVHQQVSHGEPRSNAVLVAAKAGFRAAPRKLLRFDKGRMISVRFADFFLVGVHLPNVLAKLPHWDALLRLADKPRAEPRMLVGDFNTGRNPQDAQGFRFSCAEQMEALEQRGWVDAWRKLHPQAREYSWYSHKGRGFRLDHVFLSPSLAPRLGGARFDHTVRKRGYSDHSALIVDLAPAPAERRRP